MILVSTDGSELSEKAIVTAAKLAKNLNTCVLGITVVKAKGSETAARTLDDVKDACQRVGVPCEVSEVVGTSIPDAILKVAQERDVRFIVMPRIRDPWFSLYRQLDSAGSRKSRSSGSGSALKGTNIC